MDSWPTDNRTGITPSGRGGRRKVQEKELHNYLNLRLGSLNAVTLFERDRRLEWTSVLKNTLPKGVNYRRTTTIFPPTHTPRLSTPQTTVLQRAEQGANFLRTYLPDMDIPAELIRDEIAQDAEIWQTFRAFNPYVGGVLKYVPCDPTTAFLAFPMGELNRDLNLSSIRFLERHEISFHPNALPVRSFKTPIQQIVSSGCVLDHTKQADSYLAVRTFEMTSVMKVMATGASKQFAQVAELATIVDADVEDRAIVDIKLIPLPFEALAITGNGALYKLDVAGGRRAISAVRPATSADADLAEDSFWRVALGENGLDCFLASSKGVTLQDLRSRGSLDLFTISRQQDVLTSIDHGVDNIIRLCSTRDIIWMDKRYPNKPLLGYQHGRQYDRSLEAHTPHTRLTLLTSRNNALVTVYDVSRSAGRLAHMNNLPYCLLPDEDIGASCIDSVFIQHPQNSNEDFGLVRLSDRGSLHYIDFAISSVEVDSALNTSWSAGVKELAAQVQHLCPDAGPLGAQDFSEMDLRLPYDAIFRGHAEESVNAEDKNGKAVYDLIDQIPDFWQNSDVPVEHMLTMFDVVFRSGPQPSQASRADFLTQSVINSRRGYRALLQDRLSARCLMKDAAWHHNISSTIKHLDPDIAGCIRSCTEALRRYDLIADPERDARSFKWENAAREQLALDLALSGDVFSDQPFSTLPDGSSELEAMTKTLSLAGEPPAVEFGYLRPSMESSADRYHATTEGDGAVSFNGIQALLRDWVVGTDPHIPRIKEIKDHSDVTSDSRVSPAADESARNANLSPGLRLPSSQRPPLVAASTVMPSSQAEGSKRGFKVDRSRASGLLPQILGFQSQPVVLTPEPPDSSQDYMTSTQILPGPYGGRASLGKRKLAKKRLGGF